LDPKRTSPYKFYQFWLNTEDADVGKRLRFFSLLPEPEVLALEEAARARPERREAQQALADDVTRRVHGEDALEGAKRASRALFGGAVGDLQADEIEEIFAEVPSTRIAADRLSGGLDVVTLMAEVGLAASKGEARRGVEQGGVYLNTERVSDPARAVGPGDALHGRFLILRKGKKSYHLVRLDR
jgi:tyrosyl-tRNA synthetase